MGHNCYLVLLISLTIVTSSFSRPAPDSAGVVPQPPGLSYGGIPYGSISGRLSEYFGNYESILMPSKKEKPEDDLNSIR
ncbi:hypothetical protein RUM44_013217 [Polyplax serrata]|uniref:Uncharacterized protein n=1 Tax=Polyplax serrata TaxID=468196 RepID=A0ABR1BDI4_POLSC